LHAFKFPDFEPRLQNRYGLLVNQHLAVKEELSAGLRALPETAKSFSAAQAAWRFYQNPRVSLPQLAEPLQASAREAAINTCDGFLLAIHDWSVMGFAGHPSKKDRVPVRTKHPIGYELHSVLAMSDLTGEPLAPIYHGLRAKQGVLSTRQEKPLPVRQHLDEVGLTMRHLKEQELGRRLVHLIDAEADSVGHFRRWNAKKELFLVRGDENRRVLWNEREIKLPEIAAHLSFSFTQEVEFKGVQTRQYVAETKAVMHLPAHRHRIKNGKHIRKSIKGKPLMLRLVITELRDESGQVLARWYLWTNVLSVSAQVIAKWYYWRWKIETYFKLLKRAGQHVEQWQQTTAEAIARRLLIAAAACVVVWRLARAQGPEANASRDLLVRLSGRLVKRDKQFTEPALLAGMWVLMAMLDALETYTVQEIRELATLILPSFKVPDTG
jgi:hypothetical protein